MSTVAIDSRDVRLILSALRYERARYERSVAYYRDGAGAQSDKAESNIRHAEDRISELRDCIEAIKEARA